MYAKSSDTLRPIFRQKLPFYQEKESPEKLGGNSRKGTQGQSKKRVDAGIDSSIRQGQNPVKPTGLANTARVQEQCFDMIITEGAVGMAEQEDIQPLFFRRESRRKQRLLDAVGVSVADQNALALQKQELFGIFDGAEVTVAGDLVERDFRHTLMEALRVAPAVAQMQDHIGILTLHRLEHVGHIAMGIGHHKQLH